MPQRGFNLDQSLKRFQTKCSLTFCALLFFSVIYNKMLPLLEYSQKTQEICRTRINTCLQKLRRVQCRSVLDSETPINLVSPWGSLKYNQIKESTRIKCRLRFEAFIVIVLKYNEAADALWAERGELYDTHTAGIRKQGEAISKYIKLSGVLKRNWQSWSIKRCVRKAEVFDKQKSSFL